MGRNPFILGCIFVKENANIKSTKTKEAKPMDKQPIIMHISRMLEELPEDPIRAVYMVVKQMYDLRGPQNDNNR